MTTAAATPTMTGQEIVDLTKKHTLFEWSAQSKVDPIPGCPGEGNLLLDAGREAVHRLQQPVDVGEHRARRRARHPGDSRTGADARLCQSVYGDRAAGAAGREAGGDYSGRHRHFLFHERRRRSERERDQDCALLYRTSQDHGALSFVSRRDGGRDQPDRRSAAMGGGAGHSGRGARARSVSRHRARMGVGRDFAAP